MKRKDFLRNCAGGLCAGAAALVPVGSLTAAGTEQTEDWRLRFVHRRYAALLQILSSRMGEDALKQTLRELGAACSSMSDEFTKKYRGDLDGFAKAIKAGNSGDT